MRHEQTPPRLALGISISLVAYVFFVTASSLVWSIGDGLPIIQILFFLNLISLICITPIALRNGVAHLKTHELPTHLLRDCCGAASYFLYYMAIRYLNLTNATTLNYTAPFFVPVIWWIWMREKIDRHVWWSIIVGFAGVALILNPTKTLFQEGFLFGVFAGLTSAISFVALRLLNLKKEPMTRTLFYYFLFSAIFTLPFTIVYWEDPTPMEWLKMGFIGLSTVTAQMLLTVAYRYGTASYLSPLGYSTVVYASIISWIVFQTIPDPRSILGTILIIIGGILTFILKKKPEKISETFEIPYPKERPPL